MIEYRTNSTIVGLVSLLLLSATPINAQSVEDAAASPPPNTVLKVVRQAGTCPKTVGLWTINLGYRVEDVFFSQTTVIANTLAIAGTPQVATVDQNQNKRFVEYKAPLKPTYVSCIAQAKDSKNSHYSLRFKDKNVYFRVDLTNIPDGFAAGITDYKVVGLRPFVIWSFGD
jgi:hypothetical protein